MGALLFAMSLSPGWKRNSKLFFRLFPCRGSLLKLSHALVRRNVLRFCEGCKKMQEGVFTL